MLAMTLPHTGGPEVFEARELPDPVPGAGELLIEVAGAGVNRADAYQRRGRYPSTPDAPPWPGLEVSGTVTATGPGVDSFAVGDRVCALLGGGGYATHVVARAAHALAVPDAVDLVDAAGLPEAIATVWSNVFMAARLTRGEVLLVHGGSSGIGTMAIQLARAFGARVAVTASSERKLEACRKLGADILVDYPREDFVARVLEDTDGHGADVILDHIGGEYLERDLDGLAPHGRIVFIGTQGGQSSATLDLAKLMRKWATVHGSVLRARSRPEKDAIMASVAEHVWPLVADGTVRPVIWERFPLTEVSRAHEVLEASSHIGKLLLVPSR